MRNLFFIFLFFVTLGNFAQEKYFQSNEEIQDFSLSIAQLLGENKVSSALKEMKLYWPLPKTELDLFEEKTVKYFNIFDKSYGKPIGIKKIKSKNLADVAIKEIYFIRYNITAIRLIFVYYKNDNGWLINSFKWNSEFEEEF